MKKNILLINWDCYPSITTGGVYTWTKDLIEQLKDYDFFVINQVSNPNSNGEYTIPNNVTGVIEMPIFGTNRYEEFYNDNNPFLSKILHTTQSKIKKEFLPLYEKYVRCILSDECDPGILSDLIIKLHNFLVVYDSKKCLEHYLTWEIFLKVLEMDPLYRTMLLNEVHSAYQLIQRSMQILSINVPKVDLIHCSVAWVPAFIGIFAKKESNCSMMITEHGVAFRELLLFYNRYMHHKPSQIFWKSFTRNIVNTIYHNADMVTPVCASNAEWEKRLGADPSKINVIYNGINIEKFSPNEIKKDDRPTIACVARIDVFKDIVCLIQAIKYVREQIPNVQCLIYGSSKDLEYSLRVLNLVKKLHLEDSVKFMGNTNTPQDAYNSADVIALSSITEGFPYAVIEAMACGKATVASEVGGVAEALDGCGILVRSRRPQELGEGLVKLLKDEKLRKEFESSSRKKVLANFTIEKSINQFREKYASLIRQNGMKKQKVQLIQKRVSK